MNIWFTHRCSIVCWFINAIRSFWVGKQGRDEFRCWSIKESFSFDVFPFEDKFDLIESKFESIFVFFFFFFQCRTRKENYYNIEQAMRRFFLLLLSCVEWMLLILFKAFSLPFWQIRWKRTRKRKKTFNSWRCVTWRESENKLFFFFLSRRNKR